jgi:integration host factor subunit beta
MDGHDNELEIQRGVLTKSDLTAKVASVIEISKKEADLVVKLMFGSMVRALRSGEKVEIRGFGSFRTRPRLARIARNPKTGARVEVPAKKIPYFTPSKELKAGLAELAAR